MLNNLSKDKTGAPVKWKFNKSGVKQANQVGKKLATAQEKELSQNTDTLPRKDSKTAKLAENKDTKVGEEHIPKRKPGRKKLVRPEKQSEHVSSASFVSIERLSEIKITTNSSEGSDDIPSTVESDQSPKKTVNSVNKFYSKPGRKKSVLSKDIRIKRLQILKRHIESGKHIERGRGKGRGRIKESQGPKSSIDSHCDEMEDQSTVNINQDKLKLLKAQIDSERRRGRGRGSFRRGRGRWKGTQDYGQILSSGDANKFSESSNQLQESDTKIGSEETRSNIETKQIETLKPQVGRGSTHRGRRGRPKWKHLNVGNRSNETNTTNSDITINSFTIENHDRIRSSVGRPRGRRGRGSTWTSLNRQTLNKSVLNEHSRQSLSRGSMPFVNPLSDNLIDSENESVDSNLSSASSRARKRKMFQHMGIKLGPAKLLRSQDSMKTRNFRDSIVQRGPKKRKRTLSGEFELLDEVSLRKQMRGQDDDSSTVKSFDDSWADVTDFEPTESQVDDIKNECDENNDNENKLTKSKNKLTKVIHRLKLFDNETKLIRKKGRPPKIVSEEYKTVRKKKESDHTSSSLVYHNTTGRLTIIGPGGKHFVKIQKPLFDNYEVNLNNDSIEKCKTKLLHCDEKYMVSDSKQEEQTREDEDYSSKDHEVVISVVIENSGTTDSLESQLFDVNYSPKKDGSISSVNVQKDLNLKDMFTRESEISQETIIMSLKQVKSDNKDDHKSSLKQPTTVQHHADAGILNMVYGKNETSTCKTTHKELSPSDIPLIKTESDKITKKEHEIRLPKGSQVELNEDKGMEKHNIQNKEAIDNKSLSKTDDEDKKRDVYNRDICHGDSVKSAMSNTKITTSVATSSISGVLTATVVTKDEMRINESNIYGEDINTTAVDRAMLQHNKISDNCRGESVKQSYLSSSENLAEDVHSVINNILDSILANICGSSNSETEISKGEKSTMQTSNVKEIIASHDKTNNSLQEFELNITTLIHGHDKMEEHSLCINKSDLSESKENMRNKYKEIYPKGLEVKSSNEEANTVEIQETINKEDQVHFIDICSKKGEISETRETESKTTLSQGNETRNDMNNMGIDESLTASSHLRDEISPFEILNSDIHIKRKKRKDADADRGTGSELEIQDLNSTGTPEISGKTENKRVFQLRKKASRSPLEIIAMKHSMEERQYMLEETQRAIRREEKQKKMFQNKLLRQTIEQLSPPKQALEQSSPPKTMLEQGNFTSPDKLDEIVLQEQVNQCKPCSVVLIDFVKYLKMSEQSDRSADLDELSTTEDEFSNEAESSENLMLDPQSKEVVETTDKTVSEIKLDDPSKPSAEKIHLSVSPPAKRPAKARKQAKSYNYSSKLTAEIVSSPEPTESSSKTFTVPPLRLKIKQKEQKEKVKRRFKGHKWSVSRNKARKQMSPVKRLTARQQFEFETLGSKEGLYDFEDSQGKILKLDGMKDVSASKPSANSVIVNTSSSNLETTAGNRDSQLPVYRFKCSHPNCEFKSQIRNIMESHIYIHLMNIPFKCSHCEDIFPSRNAAFIHSGKTHPEKEAKIVNAETVDESQFFEELNAPQRSNNSNVIQADIADVQHSSESLIISVRLPRNINESATGCYCCSHCDYSSGKVQDINAHVEEKHRELIQYLCSVCNKAVYRHGEGIAMHFSLEHPDQPVAYKSLPDFYDVRKTIEKASVNGDKGNIFDRMSDLFAGKRSPEKGSKSKTVPEKTSAEADSTTAETEEEMHTPREPTNVSVTSAPVQREPDGIEQLAQMFGPPSSKDSGKIASENRNLTSVVQKNQIMEENSGNDMGLKIVDVVSLQGASDFAKNVWGDTATIGKSVPSHPSQLLNQAVHRPPVLISTSSIQNIPQTLRPILPMPQRMPLTLSSNIDASKLKETTTTYKCEKCNVHAPVLSAMVEHLRTGHKDIPRLFLCPYCRQYEGATEPDIHKHIKQFHPSPDTRSPPVALSSDAKQHLRTIEVPIGDTQKVNGKYLIEKNIYKCLKCKRHMPSLDYIYEHLEKEHNEVFVYVCPDCKQFRAKEEEVVFNHIKTVHNKNTDDIILSLAIEENLFTKVQCLIKEKSTQNKGQLQKQIPTALASQGSQVQGQQEHHGQLVHQGQLVPKIQNDPTPVSQNRPQRMPVYQHRPPMQPVRPPPMQPVFPGMIQNQPVRMPGPAIAPIPVSSQPNTRPPVPNLPMNKSAMRKSRPVHIPQQQNVDHVPTSHTVQHLPSEGKKLTSPPPLMRGPPPLIRFQSNQNNSQQSNPVQSSTASVRNANFSMSDRVHRLHPPQGQSVSVSPPPPHGRPVLKVPSVPFRRTSATSPTQKDSRQSEVGAPLDLSRNSTPNSQPDTSEEMEDMSPDAFQIFNLQPSRQPTPQIRPTHFSQMHSMQSQRLPQMGSYNPNMYNRPGMYNPMYSRPPPPYPQAMNQGPRMQGLNQIPASQAPSQPALFKCPYCPTLVPLSFGEVSPHIKKFHPGQNVQFVKKD